jgi:hypothetical protein
MNALQDIRNSVSDWLWLRALRQHQSRMGYRDAPRYTRYLQEARRSYTPPAASDPLAAQEAAKFLRDGWAAFATPETEKVARSIYDVMKAEEAAGLDVWQDNGRYNLGEAWTKFPALEELFRGVTGDFLRNVYGAHFKVFYGVAYKSWRQRDYPIGSELWHADGGPGTCINLMFGLSPFTQKNGAMECLRWDDSYEVFRRERAPVRQRLAQATGLDREARRTIVTEFYRETIAKEFADLIEQPTGGPGIVYAFRNNILHKGGFPEPGEERYVFVFHIYPSREPTPFERYREAGIAKTGSYPQDPAF